VIGTGGPPDGPGAADGGGGRVSGFDSPAISLPKGGGAIRGIGETFRSNPVNGTGSMTVPLATSPGRAGFGPQLSLSCDTGSGNGPWGMLWDLSLPQISRKTDKGIPRYLDLADPESDVFVLSGTEDLVPELIERDGRWVRHTEIRRLSDRSQWRVQRYRPRTEGLFARIERWTNLVPSARSSARSGETHWRSISPDNVTTLYGSTDESRIADPADPLRVFRWLICESYDDKGNAILYRYKSEDSTGVDDSQAHERNRSPRSRAANRYLKRILYGNRTPRVSGEELTRREGWLFEVVFDFGEHDRERPTPQDDGDWLCRHDPFSSYRAGFEVRTYRLCQRVLMFHHFPGERGVGRDCLVRSTDIAYRSNRGEPEDAERGHPVISLIASVTQSGYRRLQRGGYLKRSLPPLDLEYTEARIHDVLTEVDPADVENLPSGVDGARFQWADLDGAGLQSVVTQQGDAWYVKRNVSAAGEGDGEARFEPLELVGTAPAIAALTTEGQQLLDLAGDGRLELAQLGVGLSGFHERTDDGGWAPFQAFESLPNLAWDDPNLRFTDLTGNGRADVLITEADGLTWYPSLGEQGFEGAERVTQALDETSGPRVIFADGTQSLFLGDVTGGGLSHLVRIRNGEVSYWPNLGYGRFGAQVTMDNAPCFDAPDTFDPGRMRLGDADGSGSLDLFYIHDAGVDLYLNQSGNSWSEAHRLRSMRVDDTSSVTVVDLLGRGTACLVSSSPLPAEAARPLRYIDLMGGVKPHLLASVKNNLGAETHVQYAPSTKFYLQDRQAGRPWITRLPFPVHVVERIETLDRVSRNRFVTRYRYHHGRFDAEEREFCGFGLVEQLDTEELAALSAGGLLGQASNIDAASHVPPILTKTWHHTGAFLDGTRISRQYEHEYLREPGLTDVQLRAMLLEDTVLPSSLLAADGTRRQHTLSDDEAREACRVLKGSLLRQEIYTLDAGDAQDLAFSVAENSHTVELLQPRGRNRHAVFHKHPREGLTLSYDRKLYDVDGRRVADPRVSHGLTLDVDRFGNILKSATIAYGRRHPDPNLAPSDKAEQARTHITYTESRFTNAIDADDVHRIPLACESRTFELTGLAKPANFRTFRFDDVLAAGASAASIPYEEAPSGGTQRRLIEHVRTLYRADDLAEALPLGALGSLGLPFESYKLAFTPGLLTKVYAGRVTDTMLGREGGYVHSEGDANWWLPSGRLFCSPRAGDTASQELAYARRHFFLPHRFRDPFHTNAVNTETVVTYDPYDLLIGETRDAVGNRITVGERHMQPDQPLVRRGHDYRVLQPALVMDSNRNRSGVAFDALGMVVATAMMGKPEENPVPGDNLPTDFSADPTQAQVEELLANPTGPIAAALLGESTSRIVYDFGAYSRERDAQRKPPAFVATLARETHLSDPLPARGLRIQIRFSHADGFGREIQTKHHAEAGPVPRRDATGAIVLDAHGQAEMTASVADSRWVGSGWTVFNNKGNAVRRYEPFFTDTHRFEFDARIGVSPVLVYDPLERVVAILHPNHTWEKSIFQPWSRETWDVNDTVLAADPRTDADVGPFFARLPTASYLPTWYAQRQGGDLGPQQRAASGKAAIHAETPVTAHADALGRSFQTVVPNRFRYSDAPPAEPPSEELHRTRISFDIEGNQREIIDAESRVVMRCDYDMLGNRIRQASMDAGVRRIMDDVQGKPLYAWDGRGHRFRTQYDSLRRPLRHLVTGADLADPGRELLSERLVYGEGHPEGERRNLRGGLYLHLDQAGLVSNEAHDFKGNLLETRRRVPRNYKTSIDWRLVDAALPAIDATPLDLTAVATAASSLLEAATYTTSSSYDALNRPTERIMPDGTTIRAAFNDANLLARLDANLGGEQRNGRPSWTSFVESVEYDARGERTLIEYGSRVASGGEAVKTSFIYDPLSHRLAQLLTRRDTGAFPDDCPQPPRSGWPGCQLQNLHYTYDPAGNVTSVRDDAQQAVFFGNRRIAPGGEYTYDASYRLIEATGRESVGAAGGSPIPHSYNDTLRVGLLHPADGRALARYLERYVYDRADNIRLFRHVGADAARSGWRRTHVYDEQSQLEARRSNRLTRTQLTPTTSETYSTGGDGYDAHGNMLRMPQLSAIQWDYLDQIRMTQRQSVGAGDVEGLPRQGERTYYQYDADGRRIRKATELATGQLKDDRLYLGQLEIYRRARGSLVRQTLHIMDDMQRIALVETRTQGREPGLPRRLIRFQLGDHLGSTALELDDRAQVISYEEFTPYGSTAYQAVRNQRETRKRYRYTGKERDEESGLYYYGARYSAPWLGRWLSCDSAGLVDGLNVYAQCRGSPATLLDPDGEASKSFQNSATAPLDPEPLPRSSLEYQGGVPTRTVTRREWRSIRGAQTAASRAAKGVASEGGVFQEHHTLPVSPARKANVAPEVAGETARLLSLRSRRTGGPAGTADGQPRSHHGIAAGLGKAAQSRTGTTPEGLVDASTETAWRIKGTGMVPSELVPVKADPKTGQATAWGPLRSTKLPLSPEAVAAETQSLNAVKPFDPVAYDPSSPAIRAAVEANAAQAQRGGSAKLRGFEEVSAGGTKAKLGGAANAVVNVYQAYTLARDKTISEQSPGTAGIARLTDEGGEYTLEITEGFINRFWKTYISGPNQGVTRELGTIEWLFKERPKLRAEYGYFNWLGRFVPGRVPTVDPGNAI
jgi:RHS repeat-associated protein